MTKFPDMKIAINAREEAKQLKRKHLQTLKEINEDLVIIENEIKETLMEQKLVSFLSVDWKKLNKLL